jgi:hypothetical protein
LAVAPAQPALRLLKRRGVGHPAAVRQHRQVADADVDADPPARAVRAGNRPLHLTGKTDEPAATLPADGGRQDPGGTLLQAADELAGRLVGPDPPKPRQDHMMAVGLHPDRAGGEAAGVAAAALALTLGEAHAGAGAVALLGVGEVLQRPGEGV